MLGARGCVALSACLLLLHVAIDAAPDGAERVDALVDPSSGVQPYGMNTERRAVEGTVDGTDATAVDATAVDHAPPLAMISHLARGGGSSPPLIPYELVPPWSTTMLKAAPSAVFEVDSHSS